MKLYILIPVIMGIAVASVAGIRALYNRTAGKGRAFSAIDELTQGVQERTRDLAGGGK